MTLRINASILDAIDRVQFLAGYIKEIPSEKKTLQYDLCDTSVSDIKNVLCQNDLNSCHFDDNCLLVTVSLSNEEIAAKIIDRKGVADYWVMRLVKWCDKEEHKMQITQYLDKYSEKYVDVIKMMQEYNKD